MIKERDKLQEVEAIQDFKNKSKYDKIICTVRAIVMLVCFLVSSFVVYLTIKHISNLQSPVLCTDSRVVLSIDRVVNRTAYVTYEDGFSESIVQPRDLAPGEIFCRRLSYGN